MMTREERLTEAKLMAIENIVNEAMSYRSPYARTTEAYDYAKEILLAIHNAEIAEELRQHESNLLTRDKKPE